MKKILRVDLLSWDRPEQNEPDIDVWFTYKEGDAAVEIHSTEENKYYLRTIPLQGITGRLGKQYYLTDGMEFLEQLKFAFHGSRLGASEIYEVIDGKRSEAKTEPELEKPEPEPEEIYHDYGEDEFLDGAVNILKNRLCYTCIHIHEDNHTCDAFPKGIPNVFLTGREEHLKPSKKYNQKNDIVWEYDKDQVWIKRQWAEEAKFETKVIECGTDGDKAMEVYNKLVKQGWEADFRHWDEWPETYTIYASRKKKR